MKRIAITSLYANPLHPGHVECLELSKDIADELIVIVNNDHQARLKRGVESFQDEQFRMKIVSALKPVDRVVLSIDDDHTVCKTLSVLLEELKRDDPESEIIFTKGGDRFAHEIPEGAILRAHGIRIVDGLGAKTHHSSAYIQREKEVAQAKALTETAGDYNRDPTNT